MQILNIGAPELILILLIMLIVLGPDQMVVQMRNLARFVRKLVRSPFWADIMNTSREIKDLPTRMLRDSGLEEEAADLNRQINPAASRAIPGQAPAVSQKETGKTSEEKTTESPAPEDIQEPPDRNA